MRLKISKSKKATSLYMIKSTYENKKHSTKIVEKLGTCEELQKKLNGEDPIVWAKKYIEEQNQKEKDKKSEIMVKYSPAKRIKKDENRIFNGGYLFLQQIYHELGIHKVCNEISKKYKLEFDLNLVLSRLIYAMMLFPTTRLTACQLSDKFLEQCHFEPEHMLKTLKVIGEESDAFQTAIYQNSKSILKRKTEVIYYDCANYFFERAGENQKENSTIWMELYMDLEGIPLAYTISKEAISKQADVPYIERAILSELELSDFIVCADEEMTSLVYRKFDQKKNKVFMIAQPIRKLQPSVREWALASTGWHVVGEREIYDISVLNSIKDKNKMFYKERLIRENDMEQKIVVTYSIRNKKYQRQRIQKVMENDATELNDAQEKIDRFYAVYANPQSTPAMVMKANQTRWKVEEYFRIMKSDFKIKTGFQNSEDQTKAYFTTCFIIMIISRFLKNKLNGKFTDTEIIHELREINFLKIKGEGYVPIYVRNDLTDYLHEVFDLKTDYQIIKLSEMNDMIKSTKYYLSGPL